MDIKYLQINKENGYEIVLGLNFFIFCRMQRLSTDYFKKTIATKRI